MESTKKPRRRILRRRRIYYIAIAVLAVLIAVTLFIVIPEAERRTAQANEIEKAKQQKLEELRALELKLDTMQGKIQYTESEEYLLRYAREYLGYMLPGDIRIDVENPNAPIPTAQLPLVTAKPTVAPTCSPDASPEPTPTP